MTLLVQEQAVWLGAYNLTTDMHTLGESAEAAPQVATVLGDDTETHEPGLKGYGFAGEGFWKGGANEIDDALHGRIRVRNVPFSLALEGTDAGDASRSMLAMLATLEMGASVGELLPINFTVAVMDAPVQGNVLHAGELSTNTNGTALNLGAVAAGQSLYGTLHVFSGSGNFDVIIQSATDEAFTSPTTRITFAQVLSATVRASEWATPVSGAITDTWWRMVATVPGTRDFAVTMAIQ
jgi:hypothetical protein